MFPRTFVKAAQYVHEGLFEDPYPSQLVNLNEQLVVLSVNDRQMGKGVVRVEAVTDGRIWFCLQLGVPFTCCY